MKTRILLSTILSAFFCLPVNGLRAQPPVQFQLCLGGQMLDQATDIQRTSDGGFIVTGSSASDDGNMPGRQWDLGGFICKLSAAGAISWIKSFGGSYMDEASSVCPTSDGGYIVAGRTQSSDSGIIGFHDGQDAWITKFDASGNRQWSRAYGGNRGEYANAVIQTSDGGYAFVGMASSYNGDVSGLHDPMGDLWFVKLTPAGAISWEHCYGGFALDEGNALRQTKDGGYILAGNSASSDNDVPGHYGSMPGLTDGWLLKITAAGAISWSRNLGGSSYDGINDVVQASDSSYLVCGYTNSSDHDIQNHHDSVDLWVTKVAQNGATVWSWCFGGSGNEEGSALMQAADGNYLVAGSTGSLNGDVSGLHGGGSVDGWVIKVSTAGALLWQRCYGSNAGDVLYGICPAQGGYAVAGQAGGESGDVSGHHSGQDAADGWVAKLADPTGIAGSAPQEVGLRVYPNSTSGPLYMEVPPELANGDIQLLNGAGQIVLPTAEGNGNRRSMQLDALPAGLYLLRLRLADGTACFKIRRW